MLDLLRPDLALGRLKSSVGRIRHSTKRMLKRSRGEALGIPAFDLNLARARDWLSRPYWNWRTGSRYPLYSAFVPDAESPRVMTAEQLEAWCDNVRTGMHAAGWLNGMALYERLVDGLLASKNADIVPLGALARPSRTRTRVALRHDIDAGIWAAPAMAELLKAKGVAGTFYLLHTATYYGVFAPDEPGIFLRQPASIPLIRRLIRSGREVGLHNDALSVFFVHGVNGFAAVAAEIAWLRSLGATVESTTAHNSAPLFGAENFEVFSEWSGGRKELISNDLSVRLGVLSAARLGLKFEGNHPILQKKSGPELEDYLNDLPDNALRASAWLKRHFLDNPLFRSAYDADIWLIGRDAWFIASRRPEPELRIPVSTEEVLDFIASDRHGRSIVANIHPDYFE